MSKNKLSNKIFKVPIHTDIFNARNLYCAINGSGMSGKSTLLLHILERRTSYDSIIIFTSNPDDDKFAKFMNNTKYKIDKRTGKQVSRYNEKNVKILRWNKETFNGLIRSQQHTLKQIHLDFKTKKIDRSLALKYLPHIAIVLEDMSKPEEIYYAIGNTIVWVRNININFYVIQQFSKMFAKPKIRVNLSVIFCKRMREREIKDLYNLISPRELTYKQFLQIFDYLTKTIDHGTFVFNNISKQERIEFIKTGKY